MDAYALVDALLYSPQKAVLRSTHGVKCCRGQFRVAAIKSMTVQRWGADLSGLSGILTADELAAIFYDSNGITRMRFLHYDWTWTNTPSTGSPGDPGTSDTWAYSRDYNKFDGTLTDQSTGSPSPVYGGDWQRTYLEITPGANSSGHFLTVSEGWSVTNAGFGGGESYTVTTLWHFTAGETFDELVQRCADKYQLAPALTATWGQAYANHEFHLNHNGAIVTGLVSQYGGHNAGRWNNGAADYAMWGMWCIWDSDSTTNDLVSFTGAALMILSGKWWIKRRMYNLNDATIWWHVEQRYFGNDIYYFEEMTPFQCGGAQPGSGVLAVPPSQAGPGLSTGDSGLSTGGSGRSTD